MTPIYIGIIVFISVFGASVLALLLRKVLPEHHFDSATQDTVKLTMGLVATMAALVLGLLVASAKGSYDNQKSEVTLMVSRIAYLDNILAMYGPGAMEARKSFREGAEELADRFWPEKTSRPAQTDPHALRGDRFFHELTNLSPQNDAQRNIKDRALQIAYEIGQARWLLFAQTTSSVSMPLLMVVICWLATLFFSFGLFARANGTVMIALLVAALAVAAAIFLVLEMDQPFGGLIQIPSEPMKMVVKQLGN